MGLARRLGRVAMALFAFAGLLFAGYGILALRGDFAAIALAGFGAVAALLGLVAWGIAILAAALGRGRLPRWALALGAAAFLGAALLAAAGLRYSGTPGPALLGLLGALAVVAASVRAWRIP